MLFVSETEYYSHPPTFRFGLRSSMQSLIELKVYHNSMLLSLFLMVVWRLLGIMTWIPFSLLRVFVVLPFKLGRSVYLLLLRTYGQKYTSPETEEQSSPDPICGLNSMESQFFHQDGTTSEFGSYKFKADFLRKLK